VRASGTLRFLKKRLTSARRLRVTAATGISRDTNAYAWSSIALIASLAVVLVLKRRHHLVSRVPASQRDTGWDLADDFTQAVVNSLPHES
jgi:LPXTG-motif cell wall-anchored protein